ncbi:MAG TPA: rhomboid family intramembrane serine protease, partial [Acidobacteriota bacterium]|nr:rhomboid family intramembrane serine protease [Acidobacteriota bacterium]
MFPLKDDNPTHSAPLVTCLLIALNATVFIYQVSLAPEALRIFIYQFGTVPSVVAGNQTLADHVAAVPPHLTVLTGMFMHGGWMHLIGNMWFLWLFGNN